jgi:hypothetical protein
MNVENLILILKKNNFDENTAGSENAEENITVTRGLCFMCTQNIYFINMGIKCQLCQRTYHKICLMKRNLYQKYFKCQTCLKVNN